MRLCCWQWIGFIWRPHLPNGRRTPTVFVRLFYSVFVLFVLRICIVCNGDNYNFGFLTIAGNVTTRTKQSVTIRQTPRGTVSPFNQNTKHKIQKRNTNTNTNNTTQNTKITIRRAQFLLFNQNNPPTSLSQSLREQNKNLTSFIWGSVAIFAIFNFGRNVDKILGIIDK